MSDDWQEEEFECPHCGHYPTRVMHCDIWGCDDGWVDVYDEDPINYAPGEYERCEECHGTGIIRWCPGCGKRLLWKDLEAQAEELRKWEEQAMGYRARGDLS